MKKVYKDKNSEAALINLYDKHLKHCFYLEILKIKKKKFRLMNTLMYNIELH